MTPDAPARLAAWAGSLVRTRSRGEARVGEAAYPVITWRLGHRPSLDAVRGIAVLLVMLAHFKVPFTTGGGQVGVALFFVLSGYLITALLVGDRTRTGRIDLRGFYGRRIRRLAPALLLLLAAIAAWAVVARVNVLPAIASVVLYVSNYAEIAGLPLPGLDHTWSLAVEEQFYLAWPITLALALRGNLRIAIYVAVAVLVVSTMFSINSIPNVGPLTLGTAERSKELMLGSIISLLSVRHGRDLRVPPAVFWLSAAALALVIGGVGWELRTLTAPIPCAIVVAYLAGKPNALNWRPLTFTGRISYGLYLFHYPIAVSPFNLFDGLGLWPKAAGGIAMTYALAIASWFGVERRFLRPRRRPATGAEPLVVPYVMIRR